MALVRVRSRETEPRIRIGGKREEKRREVSFSFPWMKTYPSIK